MRVEANLFALGAVAIGSVATLVLARSTAGAHCDTLDGPVVTAAKAALPPGDFRHSCRV